MYRIVALKEKTENAGEKCCRVLLWFLLVVCFFFLSNVKLVESVCRQLLEGSLQKTSESKFNYKKALARVRQS